MEELFPFLQKYEIWIYVFFGAVALIPLQQLISAWRAWQGSVYGLEREIAQRRFSAAMSILVLLVLLIFLEFVIVSFVVPGYPQIASFPTATLDLLATSTVTLPAATGPTQSAILPGAQNATGEAMKEGCTPNKIEWISPKAGDEINANIQLTGTVNVPNLGFYKYQYAQKGEDLWTTVAGGNLPKVKGDIGFWYTDQLRNGDYLLRLVVADNQNNLFPACVIQVRINNPNPK
jgi:hypothetical protein